MPEELLAVILCELGERILAMREVLADPSVATKPCSQAVAPLLSRGLDAVEERLQRDALGPVPGTRRDAPETAREIGRVCYECDSALQALHERLGLLELRWSAGPVDIFLRKLRDDVGLDMLPLPAIALSDDAWAYGHDVADSLSIHLSERRIAVALAAPGMPVITLPRIEVTNPLAWTLLLPALAQALPEPVRASTVPRDGVTTEGKEDVAIAHIKSDDSGLMTGMRLGGPAVFAAHAARVVTGSSVSSRLTHILAPFAGVARFYASGMEREGAREGLIDFFMRVARSRDRALGYGERSDNRADVRWSAQKVEVIPPPALPTADETEALLEKLMEGTPINAIGPALPDDFMDRLNAIDSAASFYELIEPLGERPASLAAILSVGWLYKVRYSYPLFQQLVREHGALRPALDAYWPHMLGRNELLLQSIEAAHVQGIFAQGRLAE